MHQSRILFLGLLWIVAMIGGIDRARGDLIVLAAPDGGDGYYAEVEGAIVDFHIGFAKAIREPDQVLVLSGPKLYDHYVQALGTDRVIEYPQLDIWIRDFATSNPNDPVWFRYSAAGQGGGRKGQQEADGVQEMLFDLLHDAEIKPQETDLINDGGNWVEDDAGRAVLSRKFLRDNRLTETQARRKLAAITGADRIAFIEADEQGGLEHADGVVSFLEPGVLIVNAYDDDPGYRAELMAALKSGLPDTDIHEVVSAYDGSEIYDERFGSACGLYTNALVTETHVYLPRFGVPEDIEALNTVRGLTAKTVVPINSAGVCHMGGGVRCLSWQLRGEAAEKLLILARP